MSNRHRTNLMGFLPALVVQYYAQVEQPSVLPSKQSFKSVVMFADISGFTNLTETLSKVGNEGPELTAFVINRYMELLVKSISKSGGDILKFAGDAMIVVWPPSNKTDIVEVHEELRTVCRMALQNALDIQNKLNDTCMLYNLKLSVKIGFGVGDINIIYVGGVFGRSEYLATGEPLVQAFSSEHCAEQGGQTIVSQEVFNLVKDFFIFEQVVGKQGFYFVKKLIAQFKVRMKAEALMIKNSISLQQFEKIKQQIQMFVPAALKPYIEIGQEKWGSELRRVSTMFISLGIDLSDARTDHGLQRIQNVIKTVQRSVYMYEGSLNKLLMDDKGSTLIVVFGLPPVSHQNDSVRAIQSSFLMEQELRKIKCKCAIGISTGVAFCGVIGTSGSRREYSILGDCVNLAARLMQMAMQPLSPTILIDEITAQDAQQKIHSIFWSEKKVKGKQDSVQIYEPLHNFDDFRKVKDISTHYKTQAIRKVSDDAQEDDIYNEQLEQSKFKQLASNAFKKFSVFGSIDSKKSQLSTKSMPVQLTKEQRNVSDNLLIGCDDEQKKLTQFINRFLLEFNTSKFVQQRVIIVSGTYGIGKSFLIKTVLRKIEMKYVNRKTDNLDIMISQLNPASKTKYLNSARILLRNIFLSLAQKLNKMPNKELIQQIYNGDQSMINTISEILSLGLNEIDLPSLKDEVQKIQDLKLFVDSMLTLYLNQQKDQQLNDDKQEIEEYDQSLALIIVCDDMQDTDEISLNLFRHILKHYKNILFVGLIRDNYKEFNAFGPQQNQDVYKKGVAKILNLNSIQTLQFKLKGLTKTEQIQDLLSKYFNIKAFVCPEEEKKNHMQQTMFHRQKTTTQFFDVQDMIELLNKVRDPLMFWESKPELETMDFNMLCVNYIYVITRGNPLYIINIINNLIDGDYIMIDQKRQLARVNDKFKTILQHEEWIQIDPPLISLQINGPLIDKLQAIELLILKQACVIGDIFDLQTLNFIFPFKEQMNQKRLIDELAKLVESNVLEIMQVEDQNIYYRFVHPFYRDVIYQRMTFSQRRETHKNVALALQKIPQPFDYHNKKEYKRLEFHWVQSSCKPLFTNTQLQPKLSFTEKKQLILKKIKQLLDNKLYARSVHLTSGYLVKRSEKGINWNRRYCVIDTEAFIISQEDDNPDHCLTIPLKAIQQIETAYKNNECEYHELTISASCWSRGGRIFDKNRKLYFAVEFEDELNEWVTYLEFAKAYAVYIDFVVNFGRISFPITYTEYDFIIKSELDQERRKQVKIGVIDASQNERSKVSKNINSRSTTNLRKYQTRKSSIFGDGYRGSTSSSQGNKESIIQQADIQQIKDKLKQFLIGGQKVLYSHLICQVEQRLNNSNLIRLGQNSLYEKKRMIYIKNEYL